MRIQKVAGSFTSGQFSCALLPPLHPPTPAVFPIPPSQWLFIHFPINLGVMRSGPSGPCILAVVLKGIDLEAQMHRQWVPGKQPGATATQHPAPAGLQAVVALSWLHYYTIEGSPPPPALSGRCTSSWQMRPGDTTHTHTHTHARTHTLTLTHTHKSEDKGKHFAERAPHQLPGPPLSPEGTSALARKHFQNPCT
jgi:hypothetical protein